MKPFKFLSRQENNIPVVPENYIVHHHVPQRYTSTLRHNQPLSELPEGFIEHLKRAQANRLMDELNERGLIEHLIIYSDGNGFTLRSEINV